MSFNCSFSRFTIIGIAVFGTILLAVIIGISVTHHHSSSTASYEDSINVFVQTKLNVKKPQWVSMDSSSVRLDNAVKGGQDEYDDLYVCRVQHENDVIPGSFSPSKRKCEVSYGKYAHRYSSFEILEGDANLFVWLPASFGESPLGAVIGGWSQTLSDALGFPVARFKFNGLNVIGKMDYRYKLAYIPVDGKEESSANYEILSIREINF